MALYIFMLAAFTGYVIIGAVPVILHTPLMSGANFVHGIVLVGAMVTLGFAHTPLEEAIGVFARGAGGDERARRLRRDGAHAGDVQEQPRARTARDRTATPSRKPARPAADRRERRRRRHQGELLRHGGAVHRRPAQHELAGDRADAASSGPGVGMTVAAVATFFTPGHAPPAPHDRRRSRSAWRSRSGRDGACR